MATKVNNNKTVRFMLFVLAFMAVVMLFVFLVVIPSIKTFKTKKAEYLYQQKHKKELALQKEKLETELRSIEKKYADALSAFKNDFDEKSFLSEAGKYFQNIKLIPKSDKKSESGLQIYAFKADFDARTPVQFYKFVDALQKMDNVVKINFPVILDAKNNTIHLQFNMSVYRLIPAVSTVTKN